MNFINRVKSEIERNEYRDEQQATIANLFFFNATGSTSGGGFHIEFTFANYNAAHEFAEILAQYEIFPKLTGRGTRTVVYIKSGECVCNLLGLLGAKKALMELHNELAVRDLRNNSNRRTNCDTANLSRQIDAASAQVEHIRNLQKDGKLGGMPDRLRQTALARLENPDASLPELAEILGITKSGLVNRIKKLLE